MGEICCRIIEQCKLLEISIVQEPSNKDCRTFAIKEGEISRDTLTWLPVDPMPSEEVDDIIESERCETCKE